MLDTIAVNVVLLLYSNLLNDTIILKKITKILILKYKNKFNIKF